MRVLLGSFGAQPETRPVRPVVDGLTPASHREVVIHVCARHIRLGCVSELCLVRVC